MRRFKTEAAAYYYHRPAYSFPTSSYRSKERVYRFQSPEKCDVCLLRSPLHCPRTFFTATSSQHSHLQQPNSDNKRSSSSSQHRQSSSRSTRCIITTTSRTGRRINSRPSRTCRRSNRRPGVASGRPSTLRSASCSVGRRRVGREDSRASESRSLVLVVGVVVEVGGCRGVDARDHRAGGGGSDGASTASGTGGAGVESGRGEAAGGHDFVDVW